MSHKTAATIAHTIGTDTGKNTLHLIGLDDQGAIVLREKIARGRIAARLANVPRCLIGIEAGMATHYVARWLFFRSSLTASSKVPCKLHACKTSASPKLCHSQCSPLCARSQRMRSSAKRLLRFGQLRMPRNVAAAWVRAPMVEWRRKGLI